jgi:hypothetical protein
VRNEARRLADEWEAKYKVSDGVTGLAEEWEAKYKMSDEGCSPAEEC